MKFTREIVINRPIEKVIELMSDVENLKKWQPGLVSYEVISGELGQEGSKAKMSYDNNGQKTELIETITKVDIPREFSATYEAPGVFNVIKNYFEKIDENSTKYTTYNEFEFNSLPMKFFGFIMPWLFKSECDKIMTSFKKFAESEN